MNTIFSIHDELQAWGKWAASCTPNSEAGCYRTQPFVVKNGGTSFVIPETRLEEIDAAISKLFSKDEALIQSLLAHYVVKRGYREIAEMLNSKPKWQKKEAKKSWNKDNVKSWLGVSVAQLEGYLFAKQEAA